MMKGNIISVLLLLQCYKELHKLIENGAAWLLCRNTEGILNTTFEKENWAMLLCVFITK